MPLCTSQFLQDLSISFGRYIRKLKRGKQILFIEKSIEKSNGIERERLDVESRSLLGILSKAAVWDDGIVWVFIRKDSPRRDRRVLFRGHLDFRKLTIAQTGEVLYDILENHLVPKSLLLLEKREGRDPD